MDLLSPPTDNFYKFLAIAGVASVLALAFLLDKDLERMQELLSQTEAEAIIDQAHLDLAHAALDKTNRFLDVIAPFRADADSKEKEIKAKFAALQEKGKTARLSEAEQASLAQLAKEQKEMMEEQDAIQKDLDSHHDLILRNEKDAELTTNEHAQLESKRQIIRDLKKRYVWKVCLYLPLIILGCFTAAIGFWLWYTRVQRFQDQLLQADITSKLKEIAPEPSSIIVENS